MRRVGHGKAVVAAREGGLGGEGNGKQHKQERVRKRVDKAVQCTCRQRLGAQRPHPQPSAGVPLCVKTHCERHADYGEQHTTRPGGADRRPLVGPSLSVSHTLMYESKYVFLPYGIRWMAANWPCIEGFKRARGARGAATWWHQGGPEAAGRCTAVKRALGGARAEARSAGRAMHIPPRHKASPHVQLVQKHAHAPKRLKLEKA